MLLANPNRCWLFTLWSDCPRRVIHCVGARSILNNFFLLSLLLAASANWLAYCAGMSHLKDWLLHTMWCSAIYFVQRIQNMINSVKMIRVQSREKRGCNSWLINSLHVRATLFASVCMASIFTASSDGLLCLLKSNTKAQCNSLRSQTLGFHKGCCSGWIRNHLLATKFGQ